MRPKFIVYCLAAICLAFATKGLILTENIQNTLKENARQSGTGYADIVKGIEEVINIFSETKFLAHNYQNKFPVIEFSIEDITDDLSGLMGNKIYTSYGVYTGSVAPTEFDPEISNRYRGKFYYFGLWDRSNALKSIEKNYFTGHE